MDNQAADESGSIERGGKHLDLFDTFGGVKALKNISFKELKSLSKQADLPKSERSLNRSPQTYLNASIDDLLKSPPDPFADKIKSLENEYNNIEVKTMGGTKVNSELFSPKKNRRVLPNHLKKYRKKSYKRSPLSKKNRDHSTRYLESLKDQKLDDSLEMLIREEEKLHKIELEIVKNEADEEPIEEEESKKSEYDVLFEKTRKQEKEIEKLKYELKKKAEEGGKQECCVIL